jgi:hypothetical protein
MPPKIVINPPNKANGAMILASFLVGSTTTATQIDNAQNGQISSKYFRDSGIGPA